MARESDPRQHASGCRLNEPETRNLWNISATFQKGQQWINLEVECSLQGRRSPRKLPRNRRPGVLVRGKKIKADGKQRRSHKDGSRRIPAYRLLNYGCEPRMRNPVSADLIVAGDG